MSLPRQKTLSGGLFAGRKRTTSEALSRLRMHDGSDAAFGAIRFNGSKRAPAKWAAVGVDSKVEDVIDLLCTTWKLDPPPVIIAVTGAALTLDLSPRDEAIIRRGLREAAQQTGAWIMSGGTASGVMDLVGRTAQEADVDEPIVCLGIVPLGIVWKHQEMEKCAKGKVYRYESMTPEKPYAVLEPNHTHFLLVDEGKEANYGGEIDMRTKVQRELCSEERANLDPEDDQLPTPMVLVVVGGGLGTLDTCRETLKDERPVVVLADSGGVATEMYHYWSDEERMIAAIDDPADPWHPIGVPGDEERSRAYREKLRTDLPLLKKLGTTPRGANQVPQLRFFCTSDDVEGQGNDLEGEILEAVLSDCNSTVDAIMHAVKWSHPGIIESQIAMSKAVDAKGLTRAFESALIYGTNNLNAEKVVKTLIDYNADSRFVRYDRLFRMAPVDPYGVILRFKRAAPALSSTKKSWWSRGSAATVTDDTSKRPLDGFKILEEMGEMLGYDDYLRCMRKQAETLRYAARSARSIVRNPAHRDDFLTPSWCDLMMWAVMVGEPTLARLLFRQTYNPMRAGIMASRLAQSIGARLKSDGLDVEAIKVLEEATMYEEWAIGVLDRIEDPEMAIDLLTMVAKKPQPGGTHLMLWRNSVMDQATSDQFPCKAFVARYHCQYLLTHYYNGDHCVSTAKIAGDTAWSSLMMQIVLQFFHLVTVGVFHRLVSFVDITTPDNRVEADPDDDDAHDDDEDWDLEYFEPQNMTGHRRGGNKSLAERLVTESVESYREFWKKWLGFFLIPRVKFTMHSAFYLGYICLYILLAPVITVVPQWAGNPWSWSHQMPTLYPLLPTVWTTGVWFEILLWVYLFGRAYEEVTQVVTLGWAYFNEFWNRIDAVTVVLMLGCFVLRCLVWVDGYEASIDANGAMVSAYWDVGYLGFTIAQRRIYMQVIQSCFSLSTVLVFIRFFDNFSIFPDLGELVTILSQMMSESKGILLILLWTAIGFGTAFATLIPAGAANPNYFSRPFWSGIRAILGDFDIDGVYDHLGDSFNAEQNVMGIVMVVLLFSYAFFTTVYIVNLMIAIMTTSYENIKERSILVRKFRRVEIVLEYKDARSPLPPPFILLDQPIRLIARLVRGEAPCCRTAKEEDGRGFADQMWSTTADLLHKVERAARDAYLKEPVGEPLDNVQRVVDDLAKAVHSVSDEMRKKYEVTVGRFDSIEKKLKALHAGEQTRSASPPPDAERAAYVPPSRLAPLGGVKGPRPPLPSYVPASKVATPSLRASEAYLASLGQIPFSPRAEHRAPPSRPTASLGYPAVRASVPSDGRALHDHARQVFIAYDRDRSGDIDASELRAALRDLGLDANSAQTSALVAKYDTNKDRRLDFVEFSQLLHELRQFQSSSLSAAAAARPTASLPLEPARRGAMPLAGGRRPGEGGGYYTAEELATVQDAAARQALAGERARQDDAARLASYDAGPPP